MSDLLNSASLVMIPSGYKEDVVYSQIPTDGSGDLTFTRASNGTRVNSAGLVEVCPWNLVEYSEQFDNAYWGKTDSSITANSTTAPNGTTTADTFTRTINTGYIYNGSFNLVIGQYTQSVYAKANASSSIRLEFVTGAFGRGAACIFDLSNGTAGTITIYGGVSGFTATIESVGNGWYRCSLGGTITIADTYYWEISITTGSIYVWGAQLNIGSTAKPYFPTTDRLNVPRLTYQNGGGGCPSLLLEKQSTNLYPYSQELNQWITSGSVTVTANDATSPDGTTNADRVQFSADTDMVYYSGTGSAGTNVVSVYAKAKSGTAQKFRFFVNGATLYSSDLTATDQWQRFDFVYTYSAQTVGLRGATTGASDVLFWGFQHEVSSYPTSYIPTTSSSATRVADACSKTGISSLIGQTEGVIFIDVNLDVRQTYTYFAIAPNLGVTSVYIGIGFTATSLQFEVVNSGAQCSISYSNSSTGRFKIAAAYKANDFVLYVNGAQIGTDTSGTVPACSQIGLFNYDTNQPLKYNQAILFPTRLTNAELASLTTI